MLRRQFSDQVQVRRDFPPRRRGEHVVLRDVYGGKVAYVRPMTVVHDRPEEVALYLAEGTPFKTVNGLEPLVRGDWEWIDRRHARTDVLMLLAPGEWYAVWLMWWHESGEFWQWYVNLQAPFTRSALGFDTADKTLDITVDPSGAWKWKDEDEFAYAQELGLITSREAVEVRRAAESAIRRIEAKLYPFNREWLEWRPDPQWGIPGVPLGWDT
jgi:Uncharacterized conserved protein